MHTLEVTGDVDFSGALGHDETPAGSVLLETPGRPGGAGLSLVAFEPLRVFRVRGERAFCGPPGAERPVDGAPARALRRVIARTREAVESLGPPDLPPGLPFTGGWIGFFGYECGHWFERLPRPGEPWGGDDCWLGFYDTFALRAPGRPGIVVASRGLEPDLTRRDRGLAHERTMRLRSRWTSVTPDAPGPGATESPVRAGPWTTPTDRPEFLHMVESARELIARGDVFQVNLSRRLDLPLAGAGPAIYRRLVAANPSPYMGYLNTGELEIISGSPENLVTVAPAGDTVRITTRPIAGTYPRDRDPARDRALRGRLLEDRKERAEHIMLVDLERNDLGRICRFGTVTVDELMTLESYSHVHHIVSSVGGTLAGNIDPVDVLAALFPGGTITGAPKIRAMEIIAKLEGRARGPYTGSMGILDLDGRMNLSILIRTLVRRGGLASLQVGAGIVADSDPEREHHETLHKAAGTLAALGAPAPRSPDWSIGAPELRTPGWSRSA